MRKIALPVHFRQISVLALAYIIILSLLGRMIMTLDPIVTVKETLPNSN